MIFEGWADASCRKSSPCFRCLFLSSCSVEWQVLHATPSDTADNHGDGSNAKKRDSLCSHIVLLPGTFPLQEAKAIHCCVRMVFRIGNLYFHPGATRKHQLRHAIGSILLCRHLIAAEIRIDSVFLS
jgi:hypothetical protein